jgi:hypothetical protein
MGWSLRCFTCSRWSLGCRDHWFCGLCERCRVRIEDDDEMSAPALMGVSGGESVTRRP